jgi:hypothetical protein
MASQGRTAVQARTAAACLIELEKVVRSMRQTLGLFEPRHLVFQLQLATLQLRDAHFIRGRMSDGVLDLPLQRLMLALKFDQMILQRHIGPPLWFRLRKSGTRNMAKQWLFVAVRPWSETDMKRFVDGQDPTGPGEIRHWLGT